MLKKKKKRRSLKKMKYTGKKTYYTPGTLLGTLLILTQ